MTTTHHNDNKLSVTINFGLNSNVTGQQITLAQKARIHRLLQVATHCDQPYRMHYAQSATEPTAVVFIEDVSMMRGWLEQALYNLCEAIEQDCIALQYSTGEGKLIGSKADSWGEFNPEYFIQFNPAGTFPALAAA